MKAIKIHELKVCPFCGSPIVRQLEDGAHLYCSNPNCPERKIAKLNYFVTKECMNIDGLSEKTIRKMCNTLEINNWYDLYNYTLEDFLSAGLGEKTALKIATELNNSKQKASAVKILVSLGIPMIGKVNATKLLEEFGSIQELENVATNTQYNTKNIMSHKLGYAIIDLIGDVAGQTFVDYVNSNRDEFKKVYEIFDNISLENKNIVMKNINRIQKEGLSNVIGEIDDLTKDIIELSKYIYEYYIERMKKEEEKKSGKKY